jgi:hypothetical protein
MTLSLAFLAPDIVRALADGVLPRGVGLSRLVNMRMDWGEQALCPDTPKLISARFAHVSH